MMYFHDPESLAGLSFELKAHKYFQLDPKLVRIFLSFKNISKIVKCFL